jgi:hypothetical protein
MTMMTALCYATEGETIILDLPYHRVTDVMRVSVRHILQYDLKTLQPQPGPVLARWAEENAGDPNFRVEFINWRKHTRRR